MEMQHEATQSTIFLQFSLQASCVEFAIATYSSVFNRKTITSIAQPQQSSYITKMFV